MSTVLATYNVKGGVGKTSAAVNLARLAAGGGAPTLLWDLDPQGASTYLFRVRPKVKGGGKALVRGRTDVDTLIKGTDHDGLDLLPADFSYRHMDLALDGAKRPTARLARVLAPLADEYEYTFLDCPPSVSLVSESVFSMVDPRKRLHRDVMAQLKDEQPAAMLETAIPMAADVERMGARRLPLSDFAPQSPAAHAYATLWEEIRARL
jgi:cellulose biosynthesis protein BcsQ